jgi:60 kDa SS-A/Ro ribonucleoprotein
MEKEMSRNTWTMRDVFRLSHPKGVNPAIAEFILRGEVLEEAPDIIHGYDAMTKVTSVNGVLSVLEGYPNLPWETIPTHLLNDPEVWKALFHNGQLRGQNAIRNVGRLNKINAFDDMVFAREFANVIADEDNIKASRLHPINYLNAITANRQPGYYEVMETALPGIVHDALNDGFHASFKYVKPANKRTLLGLDVSASMTWGNAIGLSATPAEAGAAMAMTIARTEPYYAVMGFSRRFVDLGISPGMTLDSVMRKTNSMSFGGTDCSLPMEWALKNKVEVDHFCVITDNETWAGRVHPHQALKSYRDSTGIDAKVSVIGMTATEMTIADGSPNMLDVVGFDTNAPRVLTDFSAGHI